MDLVDTHQHLWDLRRFPYTWCAGIPALNRSFWIEDYQAAARGCGIAKTLFMECDVDDPHQLAEAEAIQALADRTPLIAGIIASGRPEKDGFDGHLRRLSKLQKVRGLRRVLHTQPDELSRPPLFAENLGRLADYGYTFDLCVLARQLPIALALARACPGVTFILDHCGVPDVKAGILDPWRDDISRLADLPNVNCKVSGLVAYADPQSWIDEDLEPYLWHVLDKFGWDRVVWGGDWPVCTLTCPLSRWVDAARRLVSGASEDRRARLFHRNAERIYRV